VSLPPGASADLSITLDGRTLTSGVFSGGVTVSTDDPSFAPREIPVTMTLVDESQLDNDNDDLTNGQERALGTDPNKIDTDGDGMPDGWEVTHGLNPLVNDASEDLDGDGSTNLQEYKDKTGPLVFAAPARVVDTFDNWNYVVAQSGDWQLDATNPGDFDGDTSRAVRVSATTGSLTYWMPALVSVDVTVYYRGTLAADQIRLYSSPDNATWTEVTASEVVGWEAGVGWRGGVFRQSQGFSTDTRYLRIDVSGADPPWTPQLSQIVFVHTDLNRPVADSGNVTVSAGASATITLSGRDADANPVTYRVIQQPSHGALSGAPPNLSYTATTDYIGQDRFSFVANDGVRDSAPANIYITVQPPALAAPTNLAFTETSNSSAQLSWMAEADGSGFTVERSTDGGLTWQQIGEVSGATTSFTDSAYASGKFYSYRVRAKGQTGSISEPSDQISSRGTDPTIADSDGDGVVDNREAQLHSNPDSKDTDGDDVPDSEDGAPLDPTRWAKPIQRQYAVIDLGALPGSPGSWPLAINNHGHVLCAADPYGRYFLWQNGRRTELPGTFTPYGLNDSDMVVGDTTYFFPPYSQMELTGAYWNNGQVIRLAQLTVGYPGYPQYQTYTSSARAINNAGEIVGWSSPDGSSLFATKWAGGGGTVIPAPNSNKVRPFAISDSGAVLGTVETNSGYDIDLFPATRLGAERYQDGGIEGYRINSAGVIVNRQRQIWPGGVGVASQNINALLAPESATTIDDVTTITNANEILADAHDGTGDAYLVVLHLASANSPAQLYKVVESDQRISWMIPIDMNDKGLIAATAFFNDGTEHAVELVPVEFVEVTPALKDDDGAELPNSTKPKSFLQSNDLVEEPRTGQIPNVAYRVLKVKASKEIMAGEKVKWSMMPQVTPGGTNQPTFRGQWPEQHADRFEAAPGNADGFERLSQAEGRTTLDAEGFFAARINLPPIGFNKARLKLEFEKYPGAYSEIDFEVPAVVVIDPGHGGTKDFPDSSSNNAISASGNTKEKDMTLSYGTALMDALRAKAQQDDLNLKLFLTRKTDDNIEGHLRAKVARDHGADIFLSIHFNAFNKTARGVETWVRFPGDNVNQAEDTSLATRIVDSVYSAIRDFDGATNNRGVKPDPTNASELQRSHLAVLSDTNYANTAAFHSIRGTLCEIEFIDVPAVDVLLNTGTDAVAVKQAIIYAMRDGILYDLKHQPAAP
jgi:N-acetylmuramoyl-L-alanine amidase